MRRQHGAPSTLGNAAWSLAGYILPVVLTVAVTPIILHRLGVERYGIFALAAIFVSFLGVLDFGLSPAILKFVSESVAKDRHSEANDIISASFIFYGLVGLIGGTLAVVIGELFVTDIFSINPRDVAVARFTFVVAGLGFMLTMIANAASSVPAAVQRFDIATRINLFVSTLGTVVAVTAVYLGYGLRGLILVSAAEPILTLALFTRVNRRLLPGYRIWPRRNLKVIRELFSFSGYTFISNVSGLALFQVDKLLLGVLGSVSSVAFYVVPGNVAQRLHAAVASLTAVVLPVTSELTARDESARVRRLYARSSQLVALLLISVSIPVFLFAREFLLHWVGRSFADRSFGTFRVLILTYVLIALTAIPYQVSLGLGRPRVPALFNACAAVLNIGLIAVLIPMYGIVGAAVGYLVSTVTVPVWIWYVERKLLKLRRSVWPGILRKLALPAAVEVGVCLAVRPLAVDLAATIGLMLATSPLPVIVYYVLGYIDGDDRALLLRVRNRNAAL